VDELGFEAFCQQPRISGYMYIGLIPLDLLTGTILLMALTLCDVFCVVKYPMSGAMNCVPSPTLFSTTHPATLLLPLTAVSLLQRPVVPPHPAVATKSPSHLPTNRQERRSTRLKLVESYRRPRNSGPHEAGGRLDNTAPIQSDRGIKIAGLKLQRKRKLTTWFEYSYPYLHLIAVTFYLAYSIYT
jgi:hypothetical protein